ncbi:hypothetical protein N0V82_005203 [Gnomoniopsis sp. IMI 355080]|nr:hypothetical protein N0V82_005203 [Gnomoniopsis sp. IMI 355080]
MSPDYDAFDATQHSGFVPSLKDDGTQQKMGQEKEEAIITKPIPYDLDKVPEQMRTKVTSYVKAILDPYDSTFTSLRCPRVKAKRYGHLQAPLGEKHITYFFALDLRQVVDLLPRLLGSILEAMRFLGPENCALSIIEGNSDDGTWEVLSVLKPKLESLGVSSFILKEEIDPSKENRIGNLARLRSLALEPLRNSRNSTARSLGLIGSTSKFTDDAVVVFLNDVAACPEDVLELLHQRVVQEADMTCAMDWHHPGGKNGKPMFYDVWIGRALSGDLFFDIPPSGSWDHAEELFPFDPEAGERFAHHRPFQVFACWNGAVTFTAKPILEGEIDFRQLYEGECFQGEPTTFCKDMWFHGYGRIAVVPSVNLEYTDEKGAWIKEEKGFVYQWTAEEEDEVEGAPPLKIDWKGPPDKMKCMPEFHRQDWVPWNESLI